MGKSTGFRFAGSGPGMQNTTKLARKYLQGPGVSKKGKMDDLDWGVEVAPKVSVEESRTGLSGLRKAEAEPEDQPVPEAKTASKTPAKKAAKTPAKKATGTKRTRGAAEEDDEKAAKRGAISAAVFTGLGKGAVIPGAAVGVGIRTAERAGMSWEKNRCGAMDELKAAQEEARRRTEAKKLKKVDRC